MKKLFALILSAFSISALAQGTQFYPKGYANLDVSNINPMVQTGGDAFTDFISFPGTPGVYAFEVPRGSGIHTIFAAGLWLGGKDPQNNLYVAAKTYRHRGGIFWPGPIGIVQDSLHSLKYDRVWKVSQVQIENHLTYFNNPNYTIPNDILTWPGNGNLANGEAGKLAPYVDVNKDGHYTPTQGDYPDIKGDQALYVIFNDRGNVKWPYSPAMNMEVHVMYYGFDNPNNSPVYNTIFTEYRIINRGNIHFQDFFVGLWTDIDIGSMVDDFIGCDTLTNRYFGYNGDNFDGDGTYGYGANPPVQSVTLLDQQLNHFMYYNNDNNPVNGNPQTAEDHYNYLTAKWRNGAPLTYGGDGTNPQNKVVNYMFPGDPVTLIGWSEVKNMSATPNLPADRRGLGSFGPFNFTPGQEITFTSASTFSRGTSNLNSLTQAVSDAHAVQNFFNTQPLKPKPTRLKQEMALFPNPAQNQLQVRLPVSMNYTAVNYSIFDNTGRQVLNGTAIKTTEDLKLNIAALSKGIYQVSVTSGGQTISSRLVKL